MTHAIFDARAQADFNRLYPETPGVFAHQLNTHPAFEVDALVALSKRIRPVDVEHNLAHIPVGIDPDAVRQNGLSVEETIRSITDNGSWMVLKFVDQDAEYRTLLDQILDEIEPLVSAATGAMLKREAFIFISSPDAVTPFHIDPEHNILMQLRGDKVMTVFPAADPELTPAPLQEAFHAGSHRNLPFHNSFAAKGSAMALAPGQAIYVPVKAPHWVKNGNAMSISLSVTWRSEWSYREADAHGLNRLLRKLGLDPAMPARFPHQNHLKSLVWRSVNKARRMAGLRE